MNILVCIKVEPDLTMLAVSDWQTAEHGGIPYDFSRWQLSGFDQSAAEMALSLTDASLTLLTVGGEQTATVLKSLLALDFQRAVRLDAAAEDLRFHPDAIAALIAGFHHQDEKAGVIILGPQSSEGQNRQTGPLLAEMLGWPCITQVSDIGRAEDPTLLRVVRKTTEAVQTLTVRPPVVLIAGTAAQDRLLRIPTLKQKLAAARKPLDVLRAESLAKLPPVPVVTLALKNTRRGAIIIEGGSPADKARMLYTGYLKSRGNR
ncbi:electron transfer flavoprotein subunit beta/FixA family protein [Rahnella selenatireducens]|uniref:electron transfer flavoprotein subunit beta/FixA family protein n=1 Tax=Rahnella selenatireducens TaxID=3389797 RepID=UPI0039694E5C